ncbi:MAG: ABC transporter permease [Anaerolineaceae bacterium]|jgi:simple sugar transport system permease protein|nr:MAG: ABC transporter permease [Anaerolineaceae bacterium]
MKKFFSNPTVREGLRILLAIGSALLLGFIITLFVSEDPIGAYKAFLTGPFTKFNRFGDWIEESITLILVGLSVAIAFKANLFSMGTQGQLVLGALVSGVVALYVPLPTTLRIPLALICAMLAGFIWGWIPGYLKAYLNANEIVSTLMLNTIAIKIYDYFLVFHIKPEDAGYNVSAIFPEEGTLPSFIPNVPFLNKIYTLFSENTNITIMLYIVIIAVIVAYYLIYRTPFGYKLRMIGSNIKFARYGGIDTKKTTILVFAISGIYGALAGAHLTMGIHHSIITNISISMAFEGIIVAILARNNPLFIPITGLAYGYLRAGANIMERSSDMSREMIYVIQALIILFVTAERILPMIQKRVEERKDQNSNKEELSLSDGGSHED